MKHLTTYKLFESNYIKNFTEALDKELKSIGFDLVVFYDKDTDVEVEISKDGETYLNYYMYQFSIDKLKKDCINNLEDKSGWECSDIVKDDYDLLCTTILVFIDEWKNKTK